MGKSLYVDALFREEIAGVFCAVDARGLNVNLLEAGRCELGTVFVLFECPGYAANPQKNTLPDFGQHFAASDDVGHGKTPTWLEDSKCFR